MIIQHNMFAMNMCRQLNDTSKKRGVSAEKLASGYRISRSANDAASLCISEKMRSQISGLYEASLNAQNGESLIQSAEGALIEIHSVLQRMRELTVQAANDTNVTSDRQVIALEMHALTSEINRIATQTEFNTMKLLSGGFKGKGLQVGTNTSQVIYFSISAMTAGKLGVSHGKIAKVVSTAKACSTVTNLIKIVNSAIAKVSMQRSALGALQNRLDHAIANAECMRENLQSAESKIRDIDMADEMVKQSSLSILEQAGQSMLAQANQATQGILNLLR